MDDIELMVSETFRHLHQNYSQDEVVVSKLKKSSEEREIPVGPGVLYHIQKTSSVFVIRTFVSESIREDYLKILANPENYPSLRLLEGAVDEVQTRLKFFLVDSKFQAENIHNQLNNRRFPVHEETMCNLSDPGFSWWLTKKEDSFQIAFTLSIGLAENNVKLGPLGEHELALKNFSALEFLTSNAGVALNIQNETNRVQFGECEKFLLEELNDLFEYGVVSDGLIGIFKVLSKKINDHSLLQTTWFYLQEIAAMRRFWVQVQYDLSSSAD